MPLPVADEGMPLFPQPQGLRDSANAGPQTLMRQGGKSSLLNDKLNLLAISDLAALGHLSHRERQGLPARCIKRCIEVRHQICIIPYAMET